MEKRSSPPQLVEKVVCIGWNEETNRLLRKKGENFVCIAHLPKEDNAIKGIIPLTNAIIYTHVEKKGKVKPLYFNIRILNRDFLLKTDSQSEKDAWVKAIKENIVKGDLSEDAKKMIRPGIIGVTVDNEGKK